MTNSLWNDRHAQAESRHVDVWMSLAWRDMAFGLLVSHDMIDTPSISFALGLGPLFLGVRFLR